MRLDLLAPRTPRAEIYGTPAPPHGVAGDERPWGDDSGRHELSGGRRSSLRSWFLVALACLSLLGQGERFRIDERFRSPSATLVSYWTALQAGDTDSAYECFVEGRNDLPMPGALWFLPPTDDLWLEGFKSLPVSAGRVLVSYEVHYRARGDREERKFRTGNELVRMRGEWRIAGPLGEASMPQWHSTPAPVDI